MTENRINVRNIILSLMIACAGIYVGFENSLSQKVAVINVVSSLPTSIPISGRIEAAMPTVWSTTSVANTIPFASMEFFLMIGVLVIVAFFMFMYVGLFTRACA